MDLAARLLIFPQQKPWWVSWLAQRGEEISIDLIKQALPEDTDKIIKDVAEQGSDAALDLWKERLKHRNCYLISSIEIESIKEETVNLKSDFEQIKKCYCDLNLSEGEIAFYSDDAVPVEENKTLLPITLNLPNLKGKKITDPQEQKGRLFNVQLDPKKSQITDIIVETVGLNAGNHLISAEDVDWSTFEAKVSFSTAPLLTSLPKTAGKQNSGIPA